MGYQHYFGSNGQVQPNNGSQGYSQDSQYNPGLSSSNGTNIPDVMFNPSGGSSAYRNAIGLDSSGASLNLRPNIPTDQMQKPDYGYGVSQPDLTTKYSADPTINQIMLHKLGVNPNDQQNLALSQHQKQMNIDNYNKELNRASGIADSANRNNQNVDELLGSYEKLPFYQKGLFGHLPGVTSDSQKSEIATNKMVTDNAQLWQIGHLTDTNLLTSAKQKINKGLFDEAVSDVAAGTKALNNRAMEYQQFMNEAFDQKVPYQTASLLWNRYNQLRPAFDFKKNNINSGYNGSWQDFLTPEAIYNPSRYKPKNQDDISSRNISDADIRSTANKNGQSIATVKKALRQKGLV